MEYISIKCINFDISTGLLLKVKSIKDISTNFLLNTKLHHVGLSWIIYWSNQMKYDIKENNHHDWLNKGPRYNTAKILGSNSFIIIMKFENKWIMKLWKMCSIKYQLLNPNHLVTIKNTSCYWQILDVCVTWHNW